MPAGAILFAWLDEWFKKNWVVIDYEIPLENTRLWHNVMDAEQNYGIMGQYAGEARRTPRWVAIRHDGGRCRPCKAEQAARPAKAAPRFAPARTSRSTIWRSSSPRGDFPGTPWASSSPSTPTCRGWDSTGFPAAPLRERDRLRVPGRSGRARQWPDCWSRPTTTGMTPGGSGTETIRPVRPAAGHHPGPDDGRFDSLFVITNRARFGRDGTFFPARGTIGGS